MTSSAYTEAIQNYHMDVFEWLVENKCYFDHFTVLLAAIQVGNLLLTSEIFSSIENIVENKHVCLIMAAHYGQVEIYMWFIKKGIYDPQNYFVPLEIAIKNEQIIFIENIQYYDYTITHDVIRSIFQKMLRSNELPSAKMIQWAIEKKYF